jgi:outer membrane protein assembly factor BamD
MTQMRFCLVKFHHFFILYLCIMKTEKTHFILLVLFSFLLITGCSKFSKIQKSTDMEAKYEAAVNYFERKKYYQALQLFEELITVFRGTGKAEDTYYYYSQCYFETGEYTVAAYHFNNFYQTFPSSAKAEEALFKNAYCYYLDSPPSTLDQKNTIDAIRQFQLFINRFPKSDKVQQSNQLIDELRFKLETKDFDNAKLYMRRGQNKAAMVAFQNVIRSFPSTSYKEECMYYILKSSYDFARQSIEARKQERYEAAIENYLKLVDAFPESRFLKDAEKIYNESRSKLKKSGSLAI